MVPPALPIAIFAVTLFLVFTERMNRTIAALLGGLCMVLTGVLTQSEAIDSIEFPAISAIIGILLLVSVVRSSGLFNYLAIKAVKVVKGNPAQLMFVLSMLSAVIASFLGGTATILIVGSLIALICRQMNLKMTPYLMAAAIMSSVGGGFFLTGGSVNILISRAAGFSFVDFFTQTLPVSLVLAIATSFFFVVYFKIENKAIAGEILLDEGAAIPDKKRFYISTALIVGTIILFVFSHALGLTVEIIAIGVGLLALLLTGFDPDKAFKEVQWDTLFFLIGIFVVMGGVEKVGMAHYVAQLVAPVMKSKAGLVVLLWSVGLVSGVVPSLPITVALIPIIKEIANLGVAAAAPMFWTLLLAVNFGENLTPLGSTSSILAIGIARNSGQQMSFGEFLKVSFLATIVHLVVLSGWVLLRY
jgi:Na+/H+ antiporter NhaD/arsenite permease-like protein